MKIIKRSGAEAVFDISKIITAIDKAIGVFVTEQCTVSWRSGISSDDDGICAKYLRRETI